MYLPRCNMYFFYFMCFLPVVVVDVFECASVHTSLCVSVLWLSMPEILTSVRKLLR